MAAQLTATLLLTAPIVPNLAGAQATFRNIWPQPDDDFEILEDAAGKMVVRIGADAFVLQPESGPAPAAQLEAALRTPQAWPEVTQYIGHHKARLLIASLPLSEPEDHAEPDALTTARALSKLSAALALTHQREMIGIFWPSAQHIHQPGNFVNRTMQWIADPIHFPLDLWVNIQLYAPDQNRPDAIGLVTAGLFQFIGAELEVEPVALAPRGLHTQIMGVIRYVMINGPVLADGDTFEVPGGLSGSVRRGESALRPGLPAILVDVDDIT